MWGCLRRHEASDLPVPDTAAEEYLWKTFQAINEWIMFSDAKAGAILAALGAIAVVALQNLASVAGYLSQNPITFFALIAGGISGAVSAFFGIRCVTPSLGSGEATSLVYFAHIAQAHKEAAKYDQAVRRMLSEPSLRLRELTHQIWVNSCIAKRKHQDVIRSSRFLVGTLVAAVVAIVDILIQ